MTVIAAEDTTFEEFFYSGIELQPRDLPTSCEFETFEFVMHQSQEH
jgi:hypothetical protein